MSTEAVLAEATHLLGRVQGGAAACLDFFMRGGATLLPTSRGTLERCRQLLEKYADLPMDYADSTLVAAAEELDTHLVLTAGRRDFSIYRIGSEGVFEILP